MKNHTKIGIFCLACLMAFSAITPMVHGGITIEDTTFPADVGTRYEWSYEQTPAYVGYKMGFTADSITQGVHNSIESLIVHATFEEYSPITKTWEIYEPSGFYLAANETQDYLYFGDMAHWLPFVIPTPINLTLVASALDLVIFADSYSIDGNTITFNLGPLIDKFTFNDNGFLSVAEVYDMGELSLRLVYDEGSKIPFDNYFIIPTFVTIAIIVIFVKKRCSQIK
ncbi:MAG: hypothetical protein ACFE8M_13445 [Candidatus Hermodarchaeota archaeon]